MSGGAIFCGSRFAIPSIAANRTFSSKSVTYGVNRLTSSSSVASFHSANQRRRSIRRSGIRT